MTIDAALALLAGSGPEFGAGLSNHGPMGAEALLALGRPEGVEDWVVLYRKRLGDRPANVAPIDPHRWQDALGDIHRASDWEDFFARELDAMAWPDALRRWAPRLAPGLMAGATHGLIRTAHAVRSLDGGETPERRAEFITGLAYWAARYQELPGVPGNAAPRPPSEALRSLPILPIDQRDASAPTIFQAVGDLDRFPPFAQSIDQAAPDDDISAFLSDLTTAMAYRYLENTGAASIAYVHTVTAPSALRMLVPHLPPETVRLAARYAWQAAAAIQSRYANPHPYAMPGTLPSAEELIDRAVFSGDEHAIKFTEACLREYALNPDPVFLTAPLDLSSRYGRRAN